MDRDRINFLFLNVGHFLDHLFVLIFATVAALRLTQEWDMSYAELIPYATPGFIAFGLCAIPAGWLADKWSREGMMAIFFVGVGASAILASLAQTPIQIASGLLLIGVFRGDGATGLVCWLAVAALAVTAVLLIAVVPEGRVETFEGQFVLDDFAVFMKLLAVLGTAVTLVMSLGFIEREQMARFEYPVLFLFATLGMLMMISANDLISLYLGLELQSLSLYVIAAFRRDALRSSEAGLKYFVLGAVSSGMLLYGASMIYGFSGTTSFDGLAEVAFTGAPPRPRWPPWRCSCACWWNRWASWWRSGSRSSSSPRCCRWRWGRLPPSPSATSSA